MALDFTPTKPSGALQVLNINGTLAISDNFERLKDCVIVVHGFTYWTVSGMLVAALAMASLRPVLVMVSVGMSKKSATDE